MDDVTVNPDDRTLVDRCLKGDARAFEGVVRRYEGKAIRIAYRLLDSRQDAEDAVQEAFLRAYRSLSTWRGERFAPWFYRILVNVCTDERRRRKRAILLPLAEDRPVASADKPWLVASVRQALMELPARYRAILILRDVEGYSTRETSEILGVNEGTARVLLLRARRRLADELEKLERSGER